MMTVVNVVNMLLSVLLTVMLLATGYYYKDFMFKHFGFAFMALTAATWIEYARPLDMHGRGTLLLTFTLYGIASVALVIGALNGQGRYRETPWVLIVSLLVTLLVALSDGLDLCTVWGNMPLAFGVAVGFIMASIFLRRRKWPSHVVMSAKGASWMLLVYAMVLGLSPFALYDGLAHLCLGVSVVRAIATIVLAGLLFSLVHARNAREE